MDNKMKASSNAFIHDWDFPVASLAKPGYKITEDKLIIL
jgi:hypothetical protein